MTTATSESLFIKEVDPNELFQKEASIARMPDDDRKWPETVLSELHKQLPFLSGMDIALNFTRIQPQAGYGFGYALIRGQINAANLQPKDENQMVKIPIVVADRHLEPFHIFNFEGRTFPLTQTRFEEALENPRVFAGATQTPKTEKSLIDQLYPPYQQRQGFGLTGAGAGINSAGSGVAKMASAEKVAKAISEMTPEEIKRLSDLKRNEGLDEAKAGLSKRDKRYALRDRLVSAAVAGTTLAGLKGVATKAGRKTFSTTEGAAGALAKGAITGLGVNTAVTGTQAYRRNKRDKDRQSSTYKEHFKQASVEDIPGYNMSQNPDVSCRTCEFYGSSTEMGAGVCNKYTADVREDMVCSEWSVKRAMDKAASLYRKFLMGSK